MDPNRHHEFVGSNDERSRAMYYSRSGLSAEPHGPPPNPPHNLYYGTERPLAHAGHTKPCGCSHGNMQCNECRRRRPSVDEPLGWSTPTPPAVPPATRHSAYMPHAHPQLPPVAGNRNYWPLSSAGSTTATPPSSGSSSSSSSSSSSASSCSLAAPPPPAPPPLGPPPPHLVDGRTFNPPKTPPTRPYMLDHATAQPKQTRATPTNCCRPAGSGYYEAREPSVYTVEGGRSGGLAKEHVIIPSNSSVAAAKEQQASPNYARKYPLVYSPDVHHATGTSTAHHHHHHNSLYMATPQFSSEKFTTSQAPPLHHDYLQRGAATHHHQHLPPEPSKMRQSPTAPQHHPHPQHLPQHAMGKLAAPSRAPSSYYAPPQSGSLMMQPQPPPPSQSPSRWCSTTTNAAPGSGQRSQPPADFPPSIYVKCGDKIAKVITETIISGKSVTITAKGLEPATSLASTTATGLRGPPPATASSYYADSGYLKFDVSGHSPLPATVASPHKPHLQYSDEATPHHHPHQPPTATTYHHHPYPTERPAYGHDHQRPPTGPVNHHHHLPQASTSSKVVVAPPHQQGQGPAKKSQASKPNYRELINQVYAMRNATSEDELNRQIISKTLNVNAVGAGRPVVVAGGPSPGAASFSVPTPPPVGGYHAKPLGVVKEEKPSSSCAAPAYPLDLSIRTVKTKADSTDHKYRPAHLNSPAVDLKHAVPRVDFVPNFSLHTAVERHPPPPAAAALPKVERPPAATAVEPKVSSYTVIPVPTERAGTYHVDERPPSGSLVIKRAPQPMAPPPNAQMSRPTVLETNPYAAERLAARKPPPPPLPPPPSEPAAFEHLPPETSIRPMASGGEAPKQTTTAGTNTMSAYELACEKNPNFLGRKRHLPAHLKYIEPSVKQTRHDHEALIKAEPAVRPQACPVIAVNEQALQERDQRTAEKSIQADGPHNRAVIVSAGVPCKVEPITPTSDTAPSLVTPIKTEALATPASTTTTTSVIAARIRTKAELKGFTFNPPPLDTAMPIDTLHIKKEPDLMNTPTPTPTPTPPTLTPIPTPTATPGVDVDVDVELPSIPGLNDEFSESKLLDFSWSNTCNNLVEQLRTNTTPFGASVEIKQEIIDDELMGRATTSGGFPTTQPLPNHHAGVAALELNNDSTMTTASAVGMALQKKTSKGDREKMRLKQEKRRRAARLHDNSSSSSESEAELSKRQTDRMNKPPLKKGTKVRSSTYPASTVESAAAAKENPSSDWGSDSSSKPHEGRPVSSVKPGGEQLESQRHGRATPTTTGRSKLLITSHESDRAVNGDDLKQIDCGGPPQQLASKPAVPGSKKLDYTSGNSSTTTTTTTSSFRNSAKATHGSSKGNNNNNNNKRKNNTHSNSNMSSSSSSGDDDEDDDDDDDEDDDDDDDDDQKTPKSRQKAGPLPTMTRSKRKRELELQLANSKVLRNDKIIRNSTAKIKRKYVRKFASTATPPPPPSSEELITTRLRSKGDKSGPPLPPPAAVKLGKTGRVGRKAHSTGSPSQPDTDMLVYRYKRSLKVPPELITSCRPPGHKLAWDPSAERPAGDEQGAGKAYANSSDTEPKSIIDLLHSRVTKSVAVKPQRPAKQRPSAYTASETSQNTDTMYGGGGGMVELPLPTPEKRVDGESHEESPDGKRRHFSIFDTKVLASKTRNESKLQQKRDFLREIFGGGGGDDRPASAPPEIAHDDDAAAAGVDDDSKMTYEQKYEQFLKKMNVIDEEKLRRFGRASTCIQPGSILAANGTPIKQEPPEANTPAVPNNSTPLAQQAGSGGGGGGGALRRRRPTKYLRRKGSSGFDYIRKKKKSVPAAQPLEAVKAEQPPVVRMPPVKTKTESDLAREIHKWVLNKGLGQTAMHKAARSGYIDVIVYCLDRLGMNPDLKDNAGYTPLHVACMHGWLEIARLLLQYGANHSEPAHSGIRPLHEAAENNNEEIVRLLLSYGADPLVATYSGNTPLMLASSTAIRNTLNNYLSDVQSMGADTKPWRFNGAWQTFDESECGYDIFEGVPNFTCDMSRALRKSSVSSLLANRKQYNQYGETSSKTVMDKCAVHVLDNIDTFNSMSNNNNNNNNNSNTNNNNTHHNNNNNNTNNKNNDCKQPNTSASTDDGELFEFEEADVLLPPLYVLNDEAHADKWVLLSDLCNLLKVKSKDTLLNKIYPSTSVAAAPKDVMRELKWSDFLEKATCLQLLCAGEKLNICASKVVLLRYNESVRNLLGVKTIRMQF